MATFDEKMNPASINPQVVVTTAARDLAGNWLDQSRTTGGLQHKEWTFRTVR